MATIHVSKRSTVNDHNASRLRFACVADAGFEKVNKRPALDRVVSCISLSFVKHGVIN